MEEMIVYKYDKYTGEYLGETRAFLDPLETKKRGVSIFAYPSSTTDVEPLQAKEGFIVIYDKDKKKWEYKVDYRGRKVYNKKTGEEFIVIETGEIPSNFTFEKPVKIKELREEKVQEVKEEFIKQLSKKVKIGEISWSADEWSKLAEKVYTPESYKLIPIPQDNDLIFVKREELNEAVKYLYIRCSLLAEKKDGILEEVNSLKGKKQLQDYEIDFNIDKELKKLMKLTVEELNERFSKEEQ